MLRLLPDRAGMLYNPVVTENTGRLIKTMDTNNVHPIPEMDNSSNMTSGEPQEVRWEVVEQTSGITVAEIIAGRLQSEGIPARAWQEGAGEALGLIVGLLGTGHVVVPEEYAEQARAILAADRAAMEEEE
jgi:hypothetical protein